VNVVKYELAFIIHQRHLNATADTITHVYCCRIFCANNATSTALHM